MSIDTNISSERKLVKAKTDISFKQLIYPTAAPTLVNWLGLSSLYLKLTHIDTQMFSQKIRQPNIATKCPAHVEDDLPSESRAECYNAKTCRDLLHSLGGFYWRSKNWGNAGAVSLHTVLASQLWRLWHLCRTSEAGGTSKGPNFLVFHFGSIIFHL